MINVKSIKVTNGENKDNLLFQVSPKGIWGGGLDQFWELEGSTLYAVWELEGSTSYSLGTEGVHVIQPGNWRGALYAVWELEGST